MDILLSDKVLVIVLLLMEKSHAVSTSTSRVIDVYISVPFIEDVQMNDNRNERSDGVDVRCVPCRVPGMLCQLDSYDTHMPKGKYMTHKTLGTQHGSY